MSCLSRSLSRSLSLDLSFLFSLPDIPRLPAIERKELFNVVFDTTAYRAPPNIQLPEDYQSPALAISKLYWKGWLLLLVLLAFNPKTIGTAFCWREDRGSCSRSQLSNHCYFVKRRLSFTNLSSENNLLTFQLNALVIITVKH